MEVTITITLPDGTNRTIDLKNVTINTSWSDGYTAPGAPPEQPQASLVVGTLSLQGTIKDAAKVGTI